MLAAMALGAFALAGCGGGEQSSMASPSGQARTEGIAARMVPPAGAHRRDAPDDHFRHAAGTEALDMTAAGGIPEPRPRTLVPAIRSRATTLLAAAGSSIDCNADVPVLVRLAGSALLDRLAAYDRDCMESSAALFALNGTTYALYADANMQAAAQAVAARVPSYTPDDGQAIPQLLTFLRAGAYVAYYSNGALGHSPQTVAAIAGALNAFAASPHYLDLSDAHARTVYDYISLAGDYDETRTAAVPKVLAYLAAMIANTGRNNYGLYSAQNGIYYFLFRGLANNDAAFIACMNGQPAALVTLLRDAALYFRRALSDDGGYYSDMAANAVLGYTYLLAYPNHKAPALDGLGAILDAYPRLSGPWLAAVKNVAYYGGDCARYGICKEQVREEAMAKSFPNRFSFDDGRIVMRTAVSRPTAIRLYHAMKQVEAQFKRKTRLTDPLPDDRNAVLTMYVYGSRKEYEDLQPFLFDLSTQNGGIYIERDGAFYTYERTPSDSIYKLEELLRHEYVHYLSGRFAIEGVFGDAIYGNDRLTWLDEGSAEFFAGATQAQGVRPRRILVSQVAADGAARLTVSDILDATYASGFKFYRYAGLFFGYLDARRPATFARLYAALRDNDVAGFDALVAALRKDAQMQQEYAAYLDAQVAALAGMQEFADGPALDPDGFAVADAAAVQAAVRRVLPDASCMKAADTLLARVRCSGVLPASGLEAGLDLALQRLAANGPPEWQTLVCTTGVTAASGTPYACEMTVRTEGILSEGTASFAGYRKEYRVQQVAGGYAVGSSAEPQATIATLAGEPRLRFADGYVAFGQTGNAPRLYRLYRAAFNRKPDVAGLGFWLHYMDGGMEFAAIAGSFVGSPEFQSLYGEALSDDGFIMLLYRNVLHRAPESGAVEFWTGLMRQGRPRRQVLIDFSESDENKANVFTEIAAGMEYIPYTAQTQNKVSVPGRT